MNNYHYALQTSACVSTLDYTLVCVYISCEQISAIIEYSVVYAVADQMCQRHTLILLYIFLLLHLTAVMAALHDHGYESEHVFNDVLSITHAVFGYAAFLVLRFNS